MQGFYLIYNIGNKKIMSNALALFLKAPLNVKIFYLIFKL